MLYSVSKILVASLAIGAVQAYPQPRDTPTDNTEFLESLTTAPTVIKKYRKILTKNGQEVLNGADLAQATTFDFTKKENVAPIPAGQGGTVSMVSV
jgi:hypothetical protein